jgi:hypothetical protein
MTERSPVLVAYCNPRYSGGSWFETSLGKHFKRPYLKNTQHKTRLVEWLKWENTCLASVKPWVQTPVLSKKKWHRDTVIIGLGKWHPLGPSWVNSILRRMSLFVRAGVEINWCRRIQNIDWNSSQTGKAQGDKVWTRFIYLFYIFLGSTGVPVLAGNLPLSHTPSPWAGF